MSSIGPVIVSLSGKKLLDKEKTLLSDPMVGGLVLFRENYDEDLPDPLAALKELIAEVRKIKPDILIMVDHEGAIWRFKKGFTRIKSHQEIGLEYDKDPKEGLKLSYEQGKLMAQELIAAGVNMSLAPVLDLEGPSEIIGKLKRAFHKDPKVVVLLAEQFILGMKAAGMPVTGKHFPGHGTTKADSHEALPRDERTPEDLEPDLYTFQTLSQRGLLDAVMPAHILFPKVDSKNPAGFSEIWINNILRKRCEFKGVVMSDCLSMKGADVGDTFARLNQARKVCDFLMFTHQHGDALDKLLEALPQLKKIEENKGAAERREQLALAVKGGSKKDPINKESSKEVPPFLLSQGMNSQPKGGGI